MINHKNLMNKFRFSQSQSQNSELGEERKVKEEDKKSFSSNEANSKPRFYWILFILPRSKAKVSSSKKCSKENE
jgi:hypothetical protein